MRCVDADVAIRPVSPPLPVLFCCGLDAPKMPHSDWNEGTGLYKFIAQYKGTDVTDLEEKPIPLSSVSNIKKHGCSLKAIVQPAELLSLQRNMHAFAEGF